MVSILFCIAGLHFVKYEKLFFKTIKKSLSTIREDHIQRTFTKSLYMSRAKGQVTMHGFVPYSPNQNFYAFPPVVLLAVLFVR